MHAGSEVHDLGQWDSLWPPAGTSLVYESEHAVVSYAIHPANWTDTGS